MQSSLIDIDKQYDKLKIVIESYYSPYLKLLALNKFFSNILLFPQPQKYFSYFAELTEHFTLLVRQSTYEHASPLVISELIKNIDEISSKKFLEGFIPDLNPELQFLKEALEKKLAQLKNTDTLQDLSENSINVVLVEKLDGTDLNTAHIRKLSLEIRRLKKSFKDDIIEFINRVDNNDYEIIPYVKEIVGSAKRKSSPRPRVGGESGEGGGNNSQNSFYRFTFSFDEKNYPLTGLSFGLAAYSLVYNSMFIEEMKPYYYSFKDNVVFTGSINKDGDTVKLDDEIMFQKLEGIFFSSSSRFVIPDENYLSTLEHLKKLSKEFPERELKLVPIKNFSDVFTNLEIVERNKLTLPRKAKKIYELHHVASNIFFAAFSLVLISLIAIYYVIPHLDKNPAYGKLEQRKITVYNSHDLKLWQSEFIDPIFSHFYNRPDEFNKRVCINDIDGDGINEILFIERNTIDSVRSRFLRCINYDGSIKWLNSFPRLTNYGDTLQSDRFQTEGIYVEGNNNTGAMNIILTGILNNSSSPFGIFRLDNKGKIISQFWNAGFLTQGKFLDIEHDGKKEFIAAYCNNYFSCAAAVIFDPQFIDGVSPETDLTKNGKPGLEKYYILFPKTKINTEYFNKINNDVQGVQQSGSSGLEVHVTEGVNSSTGEDAFLLYKFDKNLKLQDVVFSSPFLGVYKSFLKKEINTDELNRLSDSLKAKVKWWDGEKFVNEPAMNKNYPLLRH